MSRRFAEAAVILLSLVVLGWALPTIPMQFGHAEGVVSAAQHEGYSNRIAHLLALAWVLGLTVLVYLIARGDQTVPPEVVPDEGGAGGNRLLLPCLTIIVLCALYYPPAFAWNGALIEENIHLTNVHRMIAGDVPYKDFEFLYGPLMLYPAYFWARATDFSLTSFYGYILALELVVMLLILSRVQAFVAGFWARIGVYVLLASLYFNTLLGPNQNGLRKLLGVLILMNVARRPFSGATWVFNGILLGLLMAYSQEFGGGTAIGITAIYASLFFKRRDPKAIVGLFVIGGLSLVVWLGTLWIFLTDDTGAYFATLSYLTGQFDRGEAAFRFFWTVNSAAAFGILALGIWAVGRILARSWDQMPGAGELMMVGGLAYAALLLKSGLSRTDQWHLDPVVLALAFALLLPLGERVPSLPRPARVIGIALIAVLAVTYTFGQFRIIRYAFREGLVSGYAGLLQSEPRSVERAEVVLPAAVYMVGDPDPETLALTEFFATPEMQARKVFPYKDMWGAPYRIGVHKAGYLTDDYIYGDQRGHDLRAMLEEDASILVLMSRDNYDWLLQGPDAPPEEPPLNLAGYGKYRELRTLLSSPHIPGSFVEEQQKQERWRRLVGLYVMETYTPVYESEAFVVLERGS